VERYEQAWAEALAGEHAHQQELLATLAGELAAFAGECAAALTALDALVSTGAVGALLDSGKAGVRSVTLVRDVSRRLPVLAWNAPREDERSGFYAHLGGETDLPRAFVHRAGERLRADPRRGDHVLLSAIIDAAGDRSVIRRVVGAASVTALYALTPIARWTPSLVGLGKGEGERGKLVAAARKVPMAVFGFAATAAGEAPAEDAVALPDSLRGTVEHIAKAARAVAEGQLGQAIAEARTKLEADLEELGAIYARARHVPHVWRVERSTEHASLVKEVSEKLAKVEKVRLALGLTLPQLQASAQALATVEKFRSVEGTLDPNSAAVVEAARMSLLLAAAEVLQASLPEWRHPVTAARPLPRRWLAAAVAVLVAAAVAIAVTLTGGSKTATPLPPTVSPVRSTLVPALQETSYMVTVGAVNQGGPVYRWHLTPPKDEPGCNTFGSVPGSPDHAVWQQAATDGCPHPHLGVGHFGTVTVTITTRYWQCTAMFFGTQTGIGVPPQACSRKAPSGGPVKSSSAQASVRLGGSVRQGPLTAWCRPCRL
jgi:hypothetical protein